MSYTTEVAADSPVHRFQLDETSGTSIANTGSNGTALTKGSGMTLNQADTISGKSVSLDGSVNAYATATLGQATFPASGVSYEIWYKGTDTGTLARWGTGTTNFWSLGVTGSGFVTFTRGLQTHTATTGAVNNGAWHHIVVTMANGTGIYQIYVDKVKVYESAGGQSVNNFNTNQVGYIGDNTTAAIAGLVDEFAVYTGVLSSTRIAAHYDAAPLGTSVTIDVTTQTATAQTQDVVVPNASIAVPTVTATAQTQDVTLSIPATVDVSTVTASVQAVDVPRQTTKTPVRDGPVGSSDWTTETIAISGEFGFAGLVDFGSLPENMAGATLSVHVAPNFGATQIAVRAITAPFSPGDSTLTLGGTVTKTIPTATGRYSVDVSPLVSNTDFYGFWVQLNTRGDLSAVESSNDPLLIVDYVVVPNVTVDVPTVNATAAAADTTQSVNVSTTVSTVTASVSAQDVTVEVVVTPDSINDVGTVTASAQAHDATVAVPVVIDLTDAEVTLQAHDTTTDVTERAVVEAGTAHFTITHLGLTDVNGEPIVPTEDEDKFFVSTKRIFGNNRPDPSLMGNGAWFRMNETSGTAAIDRTGTWTGGYYEGGVVIGLNTGPNGRKHVHFDGTGVFHQGDGYLGSEQELYDYNGTLQFAIRTTKKDQFILRMDDIRRGIIGSTDTPARDIYLKDGKINYRAWERAGDTTVNRDRKVIISEITGFKDIADGEWHIVTFASTAGAAANQKVEIYIDDDLEIRRNSYGVSFPDWIGGRPGGGGTNYEDYYNLPLSEWFVGDICEVVYFDGQHLGEDDVFRQHDTLFGYDPVYPETAKVALRANEVKVESNAKRVLTINMFPTRTMLPLGSEMFAFGGLAYAGSDPDSAVQIGDLQVYQVSAWTPGDGQGYYDVVTDTQRLIDLDVDVNLDDFDVVNVINFPQTSAHWDLFEQLNEGVPYGALSGRQQAEKIVKDIKDWNADGGSLYVTDPGFAVALGLVDRIEFVPTLSEDNDYLTFDYGQGGPKYDYRNALINPWSNYQMTTSGNFWPRVPGQFIDYEYQAHFHYDQNMVNRQRVLTLVEGLTNQPGYINTEWIDVRHYRDEGNQFAAKYEPRPSGLSVGDEFFVMGSPGGGRGGRGGVDEVTGAPVGPDRRRLGYPAAPIANVKAGTVVTSFSPVHWVGHSPVANPYKDYAVSVVVEPGDVLDGDVVGGRIYMNFTESFAEMAPFMAHGLVQVLTDAEKELLHETAESEQWDFATYRGAWQGNPTNTAVKTNIDVKPDGDLVLTRPGSGGANIVGITWSSDLQTAVIDTPTMHYRGLKWLTANIDSGPNATVGVEAAKASTKANDVTVETTSSTVIELATARTQAQANNLSDQTYANADVLVFTAQATVKAQPFTEAVELDTATVTVAAHDDFESIFEDADLVVVRFPTSEAILYMEDG